MSHVSNDELLERVGKAIQLASDYCEEFTSTYIEKDIQKAVDALSIAIDSNNLDDAYNIYLPELKKKLDDVSKILARESVEHFATEYPETV